MAQTKWWVICLCAAWCGVCKEYQKGFAQLSAAFPEVNFLWLDVEDLEDVVGDLDVETFPTLLIGSGQSAYFLGPLLPQISVLERMIHSFVAGDAPVSGLPQEASPLFRRVIADYLQCENRYKLPV